MDNISPANRPVTIAELSAVTGVSAGRLKRLSQSHGIRPACTIGRMPVYGPVQIRRIFAALERASVRA